MAIIQQNKFYDFCKQNLKLDEMLSEVKEKITGLDRIVKQYNENREKQRERKKET